MSSDQVQMDFARADRTGLSESILCSHKSVDQLLTICKKVREADQAMLFTRLSKNDFQQINEALPGLLDYDEVSRTAFYQVKPATDKAADVAIVTGGTSDIPIAKEASRTLEFYGNLPLEINDVGVAGLWRLNERLEEIRQRKVVICVAGMDAALPTVLGGLVPGLIIAVPSSVGYGVARGGETALNALLCSCAPGIVVVNIDNGYGAACAAVRSLRSI